MGSQVFHAESTTGQAYQQKDTTPYDVEERKNRLIEIRKSHLPFNSQIEYTTTNGEAYPKPVVRSDNNTQVELNRIYQSNRSTKPLFVLGHDEASYTTVNRSDHIEPTKSFYKPRGDTVERAKEQKAHNFRVTYDPSNQLLDDIKA